MVALVPAARRRKAALLVPRRGHLPRVRKGRQGRGHATRRRREGCARGPEGEV
uniref:Uncharacterized protein n=1 Tax=Arundo donax TaxID=35708 RepID=A0A0A9FW98_ARUDO